MEFPMSIKTKIAALALATLAVTGGIASSTTEAQAGPKWEPVTKWLSCLQRRLMYAA